MSLPRLARIQFAAAVAWLSAVSCVEPPVQPTRAVRLVASWTAPAAPLRYRDTVPGFPAVRALDDSDRPVAGVRVVFAIVRLPDPPLPVVVSTDADGVATLPVPWVTGTRFDGQRVIVYAHGMVGEPVEFSVALQLGPARSLELAIDGATALLNRGAVLASSVVFRDSVNNPTAAPAPLALTSSDTTVVRVSANGAVQAIGWGEANVVAAAGPLADTVRLLVRNPNPPQYTLDAVPAWPGTGLALGAAGTGWLTSITEPWVSRVDFVEGTATLVATNGPLWEPAYVPGRNELWGGAVGRPVLLRIDLGTMGLTDSLPVPHEFLRLRTMPTSGVLYATGLGGMVTRLEPGSLAMSTATVLSDAIAGLAFAPDGQHIFVMQGSSAVVAKLDATTLQSVGSVTLSGAGAGLDVDRRGRYVFVAMSGSLRVLRASDLTPVATLPAIQGAYDVHAVPEGDAIIVTRPGGGAIWVVDPITFEVLQTFTSSAAIDVRRSTTDPVSGTVWIPRGDSASLGRLRRP